MMQAVALVPSVIIHTRHQPVMHRLKYKGLSLLVDLDRLEEAGRQSWAFSVGRFNLLSFDERDHGPNHAAGRKVESLAAYIRRLARECTPETNTLQKNGGQENIARVELLTFPRICGHVFNPISVYRCFDKDGVMQMVVYEVRNTFGDMHTYIGTGDTLHEADKVFHVSPFFPVEGIYRLRMRQRGRRVSLAIRYHIGGAAALTATLRGEIMPLTGRGIMKALVAGRLWPMRPLFSIHMEAIKLWRKKISFNPRPQPPGTSWTLAREGVARQGLGRQKEDSK